MPLITKVRNIEPKAESVRLEKVSKRFSVRWIVDVKSTSLFDGIIDHKAVVVEDSPRLVPISLRYGDKLVIWKPWSYIIGHFTPQGGYLRSSIFFSYDKLKSASERSLLLVPLTNITYTALDYAKPCICLGREYVGGTGLESRAIQLNNIFWSSGFNAELSIGSAARPTWAQHMDSIDAVKLWHFKSESKEGRDSLTFRKAPARMASVNAAVKWLRRYIT